MKVRQGSVKRAGLAKNYKEAIKQYIWNAIEAGASNVRIKYETFGDDMPSLKSLCIEDDGKGIVYEDLGQTFGSFLDSTKEARFTKGGKGKGRLSFLCFASRAIWYTTYKSSVDGNNYFHKITINEDDSQNFDRDEGPKPIDDTTGTKVEFLLLKNNFGADDLESEDFEQFLALEFGWYLEVYGKDKISILRNGVKLDYTKYIEDTASCTISVSDDKTPQAICDFRVSYMRWSEKIGTESYFYFLNGKHSLIDRKTTGFNTVGGRAYGFVHSLYIQSEYFDNFTFTRDDDSDNSVLDLDAVSINQKDKVFKQLLKELKTFVETKRNEFLKHDSEAAIQRFAERRTLPIFTDDPLGKSQEEDYIQVLKGMYKTVPTLFTNLQEQQEKSLLGLLNLTLKTDEREHVIDILGSIVDLKPSERKELAELLKNAKLSGIIKLLRTLESRYEVVELLRSLVFNHTKTATERGQLQEAIENNCWLFGEDYNLIGTDSSFSKLQKMYLEHIDMIASDAADVSKRRPDVFITRSKKISTGMSGANYKLQNLIIELKRPSVNVGVEQYRQIEDYRNIIRDTPTFKSDLREWHFFIIGVDIEVDIRNKREAMKHENRQFLVNKEGDFYIYAVTWAEVFDTFEVRHDYLLKDLDIDKSKIVDAIQEKHTESLPQAIADEVIKIGSEKLVQRQSKKIRTKKSQPSPVS